MPRGGWRFRASGAAAAWFAGDGVAGAGMAVARVAGAGWAGVGATGVGVTGLGVAGAAACWPGTGIGAAVLGGTLNEAAHDESTVYGGNGVTTCSGAHPRGSQHARRSRSVPFPPIC